MSEDYAVEAIRGWRYHSRKKCLQYLIKWQGYSEEENTWEPNEYLSCPDLLKEFEDNLSPRQSRYYNVKRYDKLTGFQRNAKFVGCIGADGPHDSDDEESTKVDKQQFYCLIEFDDSDLVEEVTIKEFLRHMPEEAFKFMEGRILAVTERI